MPTGGDDYTYQDFVRDACPFDPVDEIPYCDNEHCPDPQETVCTVNVGTNGDKKVGARCPTCDRWARFPNGKMWLSGEDLHSLRMADCQWLDGEWDGSQSPKERSTDPEPQEVHSPANTEIIHCCVKGCPNTNHDVGIENHHFAPKALFGKDAENWPVEPVCLPHHEQWHETINLHQRMQVILKEIGEEE